MANGILDGGFLPTDGFADTSFGLGDTELGGILTDGVGPATEIGISSGALGGTLPGVLRVAEAFPTDGGGMIVPAAGPPSAMVQPLVAMARRVPPIVRMALAKMAEALHRRNVSVPAAIALARRIGIPGLVALGLTIAEIAGLLLWGQTHKHRRMNVLNPKALSRSTRRLLGFERRAARVQQALAGVCRTRRRGGSKRRGACGVCHQSPCRCP